MPRGNGSYVGVTVNPTASVASGIWTVREAEAYLRADKWPTTPNVPGSPTGESGDTQVSLTWAAPTGGSTPTDYIVQYSSNAGSTWTTFADGVSTETSATVTGLTNGTGYIFRIIAVNALGEGPYGSASGTVTPAALTPSSLLLHFNGSNGSTTFTDSNITPKTVTAYGGAAISTTESKFGGASGYFDGDGDYLEAAHHSSLEFGDSDWTIDFWVYTTGFTSSRAVVGKGEPGTVTNCWSIEPDGGNSLGFFVSTGGEIALSALSATIPTSEWAHVALVCSSGVVKFFVNGVGGSNDTLAAAIASTSGGPLVIGTGWFAPSARGFTGYIDELRIVKGTALFTGDFTPATAAY